MEIRCSKLARPMVCAGFMFLDTPEPEAGEAGKEGTAAGEYLEAMLTGKPIGISASNGVYITDDMKFYLTPIAQDVISRAASPILCEQRIDWQTQSGIWIRGRYDMAFVDKQGRLCIEDLKYGWGIVEVKENWQLIGYAIGVQRRKLGRQFYNANSIVSVISVDTLLSRQENYAAWALSIQQWITDEAAHVLRENKWGRGVSHLINARGLLVTGTPGRPDGKGLGRGELIDGIWTNDGL